MKTIWKFELEIVDEQVIKMPVGALLLQTAQIQNITPVIWAICDSLYKMEEVTIITIGTGNPIDILEELMYLGTYQLRGFVGHVFVKKII